MTDIATECLGKSVTVRSSPRAVSGNDTGNRIPPYTSVPYAAIVPDQDYPNDPTRQWLQLTDGTFCNFVYPPSGYRFTLASNPALGKTLYRVLHEYEQAIYNFHPQCLGFNWKPGDKLPAFGEPEVVTTYTGAFNSLNQAWQQFWYSLLQYRQPSWSKAQLTHAWADLTHDGRAFTDHHSWNNGYADYIQKLHLNKSPIAINSLSCGGNVVSVNEHDYFFRGSETYYRVETLDPSRSAPPAVVIADTMPWLIHRATNATVIQLDDGTWRVDPFPQLDGADVLYPFCNKGANYMAASKLVKLTDSTIPSPYHP